MAASIYAGPTGRNSIGTADRLFVPDAPRRSHDAPGVLAHHQALFEKSRRRERAVAAYIAARLCHALAESRSGSARGANAAGPQRFVDHPDIHARRPRAFEGPAFRAPPSRLTARPTDGRLLESREPLKTPRVEHLRSDGAVRVAIPSRLNAGHIWRSSKPARSARRSAARQPAACRAAACRAAA